MGLEKLNEFKKKKGLTNLQLSQITGITISTIDKITSGNNKNPKLETIKSLCKALDCTLDDLLDDTEYSEKQKIAHTFLFDDNYKKQQLIDNYEKLNEIGKEKLVDYASDLLLISKYNKSTIQKHESNAQMLNSNTNVVSERKEEPKEETIIMPIAARGGGVSYHEVAFTPEEKEYERKVIENEFPELMPNKSRKLPKF